MVLQNTSIFGGIIEWEPWYTTSDCNVVFCMICLLVTYLAASILVAILRLDPLSFLPPLVPEEHI